MTLEPLLRAPLIVSVHAFLAMAAFALGIGQFLAPKGTLPHRVTGWIWVGLMAGIAISSFWISVIRMVWPFSPIHLLSILTLILLPLAVLAARSYRTKRHAGIMIGLFIGALVIAGGFTFMPGRIMHDVAVGRL